MFKHGAGEVEKVTESIRKKYGNDSIKHGGDYPEVRRIPTGIVGIDSLLGGGFPLGRWSHIYGGFSSCKTLIAINLIKSAQDMGLSCAYYDIENQYDSEWFSINGVDTEKLIVIDGSVIEEVGEKLQSLLTVINVHVLDSLGLGVSRDELAADMDKWLPGIAARAWGKVLRQCNQFFDKEHNSVILINQTRVVFGKNVEEPTGGKAINFISSLNLKLSKSSWLFYDKNGNLSEDGVKTDSFSGDTQPSGIELQVRVDKSRLKNCAQNSVGRVRLKFDDSGSFDDIWTLTRAAIYNGFVEKSGSWYTLPDGTRVQGDSKVRDYIKNNQEFAEEIKKSLSGES